MAVNSIGYGDQFVPQRTALVDHEALAVELVRALRGRLSRAELSRRAGYRSNIVHRWETRACWPTAARFLSLHHRLHADGASWIGRFFHGQPAWVQGLDTTSPEAVATFLRHLKGKAPIAQLAERAGYNRYRVSRWLSGQCEPRLPEFLRLVDAATRRLLDLVAAFCDPARLYSVRDHWAQLQLARQAAYELPWSHAVLRALELHGAPTGPAAQRAWIARHLALQVEEVDEALTILQGAGQVERTRRGFRLAARNPPAIDTRAEPVKARQIKVAWAETAVDRLRAGHPGRFGYSLFAVTRADLARLHQLHLQYVRAMQEVIASSERPECVGLYCSQLLDLRAHNLDSPE